MCNIIDRVVGRMQERRKGTYQQRNDNVNCTLNNGVLNIKIRFDSGKQYEKNITMERIREEYGNALKKYSNVQEVSRGR